MASTNSSASSSGSTAYSQTTSALSASDVTVVSLPVNVPTYAYVCEDHAGSAAVFCTQVNNVATPIATVTWSTAVLTSVTQQRTSTRPALVPSNSLAVSNTSSIQTSTVVPSEGPAQSDTESTAPTAETSTHTTESPTSATQASGAGETSNVPDPNSIHNGVSSGTVAGAAVGCFFAGLLIAGVLAFYFMRKRSTNKRYASPAHYVPAPAHPYGGEKGTPMVAIAPVAAGNLDFLPQQADDAEIRRKLSTVIDQIDQHVENFYANRSVPLTAAMEGDLSRFETSQLPQPLAACFEQSIQPTVLIKHCLAFHIFNLTMAPGEGTKPILPAEIAGMIGAVYNRSLAPDASKDTITAFTTWKQLTSYLRPDLLRDPAILHASNDASTRIASHFTAVFAPWRNDAYSDDQRSRHLTELLDHAIHTAIWLFGQPDSYRFDWNVPTADAGRSVSIRGRSSSKVVVAPGVSKLTHGGARLPGAGQQLIAAVVKRM